MSSISFNVRHEKDTKRVTITRNSAVGDLLQLACSKFGLASGELIYNKKMLDVSLPIKFTNLLNNGTLELKAKTLIQKTIVVKVVFPDNSAVIKKVSNTMKLADLVSESGITTPTNELSVGYLQKSVLASDNESKELHELIGDVENAVLRFGVLKDVSVEQRLVVERQLKLQQQRQEVKKQKLEEENDRKSESMRDLAVLESKKISDNQTVSEIESETQRDKPSESDDMEVDPQTRELELSVDPWNQAPEISVDTKVKSSTKKSVETTVTAPTSTDKASVSSTETAQDSDVVYKPTSVHIYENPDEDYEFTAAHARIYQNLVKYKNPKRKAQTKQKLEAIYKFRIKFPNSYILEVHLSNTCKFGELIKKIDTYVADDFKSNYILKLSYPPFKKYEISFALNGTPLAEIEEFDSQILLIFEPNIPGTSFLNGSVNEKEFSDMPEIQLEEHRHSLPEDDTSSKSKSSSGGKKTPKWLKLGK
ncbi:hypothetical protein PSN45_001053 [Yamadazyma tenuis]|uniref:TUG ubiquitin-like domain-containing protein n=1 Tax=Candida tenuis (strain ATCC 10573 / BCRC 21748 / CBS 615 / JCM 9827 / NBRC 10315 / NRRL Y-1498 / VKM Y-70) TaxID=590646 RepID=G3B806_CANTC|nr:uncharacterized protein CANTEDRAFT_95209 [Yamadazyma tenuis ATCC 10573]EGV62327.1 hypothetical protein CANTEDRAFT_95209 [Yamadazyma tenuis ATCC 10573]WEJ93585.1 hypothetical protein PSN45_001053 [Yamadazyma tenuis]